MADQLAKEGSKKQQPESKLSYQEAKTLIRNKGQADLKHINGGYNPQLLNFVGVDKQNIVNIEYLQFKYRKLHLRHRYHIPPFLHTRLGYRDNIAARLDRLAS